MGHTAALYTVRVKKRFSDYQLLGGFDEDATSLLDVLGAYLPDFEQEDADRERVVRCLSALTEGDELVATMQHGQSGVAADIVDDQGDRQYRQVASDTQLLRCGCLFKLPSAETTGWLALHINNGRGIKGLLATGLWTRFREEFADYTLEINPYVQQSALMEAIEQDQLLKVKLIRYEKPHDRAVQATNRWVHGGSFGKLELDISVRGRGEMLKADLLKRFYRGDQSALGEIIEFAGIPFEQAKIEVDLDGRLRTFNIERPESGHPMTVDLEDLVADDDGEPTPDSVLAALRAVLGSV